MSERVKSKSKFKTTLAIALTALPIALGGALIATNPSKESYASYALTRLCEYPDLPPQIVTQFRQACQGSAANEGGFFGTEALKRIIASQTQQQNFLFYSTYKTEVFNKTFTTLGIFGQFITFGAK